MEVLFVESPSCCQSIDLNINLKFKRSNSTLAQQQQQQNFIADPVLLSTVSVNRLFQDCKHGQFIWNWKVKRSCIALNSVQSDHNNLQCRLSIKKLVTVINQINSHGQQIYFAQPPLFSTKSFRVLNKLLTTDSSKLIIDNVTSKSIVCKLI